MLVTIDGQKCCAAGNCEADMPDVFEVQDTGPTRVISQPGEDRRTDLEWIASNCPTQAISVG